MSNRLVKNLPKEDYTGSELYVFFGKVFVGCGVASFVLMTFVSTLPQDYEKYNIPLFFGIWMVISLGLIALGATLVILAKKSKKFQAWAERDTEKLGKYLMEKELRRDKKGKR